MPWYRIEATEHAYYQFDLNTNDHDIPDEVDVTDIDAVREWLTGTYEGEDVIREGCNDSTSGGSEGVVLDEIKRLRIRKTA